MKQYINVARQYNDIYVRYIEKDKEQRQIIKNVLPSVYKKTNKQTNIKSFYNDNLEKINIYSSKELKELKEEYDTTELFGQKDIVAEYISNNFNKDIDISKINTAFIDIEVFSKIKGNNGKWIDAGFPVATEARYPISSITQYNSNTEKYYTFSVLPWDKNKVHSSLDNYKNQVVFVQCKNEIELLQKWLTFWKSDIPAILSGWNSIEFDVTYICGRLHILFGRDSVNELSPWGIVEKRKGKNKFLQEIEYYDILGVASMDYADIYKKFRLKPRAKYSLEFISNAELNNESKIKYEGSLNNLFFDNPQLYNDYNIQDVRLLVAINDKLNFIALILEVAYFAGINFQDVYSPVKTWETLIYKECIDNNIIIPWENNYHSREAYDGAYVHDPIPGLYKKIVSFDLTSLYPSIMRQWSISREKIKTGNEYNKIKNDILELAKNDDELYNQVSNNNIVEYYVNNNIPEEITKYLQKNNISMTANCQFFDIKTDALFSILINRLFKMRKENKKLSQEYKQKAKELKEKNDDSYLEYEKLSIIYDVKQHAMKISLNSFYGASGSPYFKYYNTDMASAITLTGQAIIRKSAKTINYYLNNIIKSNNVNYLVYIDTDSCYFELENIYDKYSNPEWTKTQQINFIDKICKKIELDALIPLYENIHSELNCHKNNKALHMDRETICTGSKKTNHCGFWTAKKRYALLVDDNEGFRYNEPNLKIMGLLQPSTVSDETNTNITKAIELLISEGLDTVRNFETELYNQYMTKSVEDIAFSKSVSGVDKFIDTKTGLPWEGEWYDRESQKTRNGGVPINSRAAIHYNYLIKKLGLEKKYPLIKDHDKIKYVPLINNKYNFGVIGFIDKFPEEFELNKFVDYNTQYEKSIKSPISDILLATGLSLEKKGNISDFF